MAEKNKQTETVAEESTELQEFNWDDNSLNLFDEAVDADETSLTPEEIEDLKKSTSKKDPKDEEEVDKKDTKKTSKKEGKKDPEEDPEKETEDPEKEETFFEEKKNPEEEDEHTTDVTKSDEFYKTLASTLVEKGVFSNIEIGEDDEITEDRFLELQDEELNSRVDEVFKGFFNELDEDGVDFLKFKQQGGKTSDYFEYARQKTPADLSTESEKDQEEVIRFYSKSVEGLDDDEVNDRIDWLKDSDKLEKYSQNYLSKLQKLEKSKKDKLIAEQAAIKKQKENEAKEFKSEVSKALGDIDEVNGFKINKKDKEELTDYITSPSVKIGVNKYITPLQRDLKEVIKDKNNLILLAKLIKSGFDTSDVLKTSKTKSTKELKTTLQRLQKDTKPPVSGSSKQRQLSDFF